jgi:hypothetical protein
MYGIAEAKQIFGEIGAVLPGNAGKERNAPFRILNRHAHSTNAPGLAKSSPTTPNRNIYYAGPAGDAWSHGHKPDGPNPYHDPLRSNKCSPVEAVTGEGGPGLRVIEPWITIKPRKGRWPEWLKPRHLSPVISKKAN